MVRNVKEILDNIYLRWETLNQNGNKKIEKHIVAECHESHKVQSSPMTGLLHPVEQHDIPVFLCEYLAHMSTFRAHNCHCTQLTLNLTLYLLELKITKMTWNILRILLGWPQINVNKIFVVSLNIPKYYELNK